MWWVPSVWPIRITSPTSPARGWEETRWRNSPAPGTPPGIPARSRWWQQRSSLAREREGHRAAGEGLLPGHAGNVLHTRVWGPEPGRRGRRCSRKGTGQMPQKGSGEPDGERLGGTRGGGSDWPLPLLTEPHLTWAWAGLLGGSLSRKTCSSAPAWLNQQPLLLWRDFQESSPPPSQHGLWVREPGLAARRLGAGNTRRGCHGSCPGLGVSCGAGAVSLGWCQAPRSPVQAT